MVNAKPVSLAQYKGKPLVLAFILTTCPHCQHMVELLSKLQPACAPRGLQVLAAAIDPAAQNAVPLFVKNFHPPFPVGFAADGYAVVDFCGYARDRLPYMPILLFIGRDGAIREQHQGADSVYFGDQEEQNLRASIEALLGGGSKTVAKKPAPAPKTAPKKSS